MFCSAPLPAAKGIVLPGNCLRPFFDCFGTVANLRWPCLLSFISMYLLRWKFNNRSLSPCKTDKNKEHSHNSMQTQTEGRHHFNVRFLFLHQAPVSPYKDKQSLLIIKWCRCCYNQQSKMQDFFTLDELAILHRNQCCENLWGLSVWRQCSGLTPHVMFTYSRLFCAPPGPLLTR